MKKILPINTTADGCAFTVRARYDGACLKSLTGGGRILPEYGGLGGVVGYVNTSQDGAICHKRAIVPCLTSGHGNCPKVIMYVDDTDEGERV